MWIIVTQWQLECWQEPTAVLIFPHGHEQISNSVITFRPQLQATALGIFNKVTLGIRDSLDEYKTRLRTSVFALPVCKFCFMHNFPPSLKLHFWCELNGLSRQWSGAQNACSINAPGTPSAQDESAEAITEVSREHATVLLSYRGSSILCT